MQFVKSLLRIVGKLVSFIWGYRVNKLISYYLLNYVYSGWVSRSLKHCGSNAFIARPLFLYGGKNISIGQNFRTERCLRLEAHNELGGKKFNSNISIGNNVSINFNCHIACINKIVIADGVLIASNVLIIDNYHGLIDEHTLSKVAPSLRLLESKGPVIIEENVWIGEGACIMPNLTIGAGSIIGANAVVTKSFPPNSIIGGVPARLLNK